MATDYTINNGTLTLGVTGTGATVPGGGDLAWFGGPMYYNDDFTFGSNFQITSVALAPGQSIIDVYVATEPSRPLTEPTPPPAWYQGPTLDAGDLGYGPVTFVGEGAGVFVVTPIPGENAVQVSFMMCLAAGTLIATPDGERPVESLRPGNLILARRTGTAVPRPVAAVHAWSAPAGAPPPVRIAAGAFAPDLPRRDLLLSPDHAVFADGLLVPARQLVNGLSIVRDTSSPVGSPALTYVHVELDSHDLMTAEGLTVETLLPPDAAARHRPGQWSQLWEAHGCAPLTVAGAALDALRGRLFQRAAACGLFARAA